MLTQGTQLFQGTPPSQQATTTIWAVIMESMTPPWPTTTGTTTEKSTSSGTMRKLMFKMTSGTLEKTPMMTTTTMTLIS